MSWGHGAVQRALLAELRKQQQAIDTMSLLQIICDGDDLTTHGLNQAGERYEPWPRKALLLHRELLAHCSGDLQLKLHRKNLNTVVGATLSLLRDMELLLGIAG